MPDEKVSTGSHFRYTLSIDGRDEGVWDLATGLGRGSEVSKHRAGGSLTSSATLPGAIVHDDVTVNRGYQRTRDHDLARRLIGREGRAPVVLKSIPLDADMNPYGRPTTRAGVLMRVNEPDYDSNSTDTARLELVLSVESIA